MAKGMDTGRGEEVGPLKQSLYQWGSSKSGVGPSKRGNRFWSGKNRCFLLTQRYIWEPAEFAAMPCIPSLVSFSQDATVVFEFRDS